MQHLFRITLVCLFAVTTTHAQNKFRVAPKSPQEALKTFKLAEGFRIELVAAEPLIRDPVAIAFDERARMYVVEYPEFNKYSFKPGVKVSSGVKLLEDTNGDGKFDKATKFVSDIPLATAVACYDGGVFVGAAPHVLFCKDTDGDGKADVKRVVLSGFGRDFAGGGLLNSFLWGMDNRIHIATGFAGGRVSQRANPKARPISVQARGIILDPLTGLAEGTSGGGQHGLGMDDWGTKYLCSNVTPIQQLVYDARYVARNPYFAPPSPALNIRAEPPLTKLKRISPLEPWRIIRSQRTRGDDPEGRLSGGVFTSASGITIYRGDAWPKETRGQLLVGEVANNLVYRARLSANGIPNVARRMDKDREFLASNDIWFRPVQFANGPDGNLYVVDMYRELIEGAAFVPRDVLRRLDPASGTNRGRIYRIVAAGRRLRRAPRLDKVATAQLVNMLDHDNGWHRDTAARLIYQRQDHEAESALRKLLRTNHQPRTKAHALHALAGLNLLRAEDLLPLVDSKDERLAMTAIRLAERWLRDSPRLAAKVVAQSNDTRLRIRAQVAFTLGADPSPRHTQALLSILKRDAGDAWLRTAVQSSLINQAGFALFTLTKDKKFRRSQPGQRALLELAAQIGAENRPSDLVFVANTLQAIPQDEQVRKAITKGLLLYASDAVRTKILGKLDQVIRQLVHSARQTASDPRASAARRAEAIRSLSLSPLNDELKSLFLRLIQDNQSEVLQQATLQALARFNDSAIPTLILKHGWQRYSPSLRRAAIEVLLSQDSWTRQLLAALESGAIGAGEISRDRLSILSLHTNDEIRRMARRLLKKTKRSGRAKVIRDYLTASKSLKGNVTRGAQVFQQNCAQCHRRKDRRVVAGDLLDTARRSPEAILIHVLDPNREVKPKFTTYLVQRKDGRVLTGMIIEETETSLRVQQSDGKAVTVLRVSIKSLKTNGRSFMPEGLEKKINHQAMVDLVAFLRKRP